MKKKYNDPAYKDEENNNGSNADAAGGRRKREKRYRATRKNGKRSQKHTRKH